MRLPLPAGFATLSGMNDRPPRPEKPKLRLARRTVDEHRRRMNAAAAREFFDETSLSPAQRRLWIAGWCIIVMVAVLWLFMASAAGFGGDTFHAP